MPEGEQLPRGYAAWRRVHIVAGCVVSLLGIAHCLLALLQFQRWDPEAVWFLGAGLGVLFVGTLNLVHIGLAPCRMPTVRFVRVVNAIYGAFGVAALVAVPEPHVMVLVGALLVQVIAGRVTLPGPA